MPTPGGTTEASDLASTGRDGWADRLVGWLGRATFEDRQAMLKRLFGDRTARQHFQFWLMMWLSVTIAVMGLSLGSAAVVIGAMLIAPLMTPVMQFAGGLALGWPRRMGRAATVIVAASLLAVAYAWLLARLLPQQALTDEVLGRTAPDIRDLLVALAAGTAGAYATARRDVSTALPGVAVAVALVPPLAAAGLVLEAGRRDYAEGAALLYAANLVAIVLSGTLVFIVTGLVPRRRLRDVTPRVVGGYVAVLLTAVVIGVPLAARSITVADRFEETTAVTERVITWLGPDSELELEAVSVDGNAVTVDVAGPDVPPPTETLTEGASVALGRPVSVEVRWQQRSDLSNNGNGTVRASQGRLAQIVEDWLADAADGQSSDRVDSVAVRGDEVRVELSGAQAPPPANSLAERLADELGSKPTVRISWTQQVVDESGRGSEALQVRRQAKAAADAWAQSQPGLDVIDVAYADGTVTIDLAGSTPPASAAPVVRAVRAALAESVRVEVRFVERRIIG